MESANKPSVNTPRGNPPAQPEISFLADADELELRPLPAFARITLPVLVIAFIAAIIWASFSQIDQIVVARGRLINPLPNVVLQPLETSIVQSIDVRIGQVVKKGERLAMLDPTFAKADEDQLRIKLRSLTTQSDSMSHELAGTNSVVPKKDDVDSMLQSRLSMERKGNFDANLVRMEQEIARLLASLETNQRDQLVLAARLKSVTEIEAMQEKLVAQQYGARLKLLEARDKRLEVEREQLLSKNREEEIRRELSVKQADKLAFNKAWRQKTMEEMLLISRERDTLKEQLQKADKRHRLVSLYAPMDAVILDIAKLSPGSIVREAEPFFTLVPLNAELEAEVQIDALDVGYVNTGDSVHVKLDAFPFQRHGGLSATVRTMSEDAFKRDSSQVQGLDAYYVSRIALKSLRLNRMPAKARLLPGMTLTAEIVVGKRTVMSYLLWPLTKTLDESIREP